jgi:hypothetical protein
MWPVSRIAIALRVGLRVLQRALKFGNKLRTLVNQDTQFVTINVCIGGRVAFNAFGFHVGSLV